MKNEVLVFEDDGLFTLSYEKNNMVCIMTLYTLMENLGEILRTEKKTTTKKE